MESTKPPAGAIGTGAVMCPSETDASRHAARDRALRAQKDDPPLSGLEAAAPDPCFCEPSTLEPWPDNSAALRPSLACAVVIQNQLLAC
jgi:hypothetical protein